MITITTQEAETHFLRYLRSVEAGQEIIIARDSAPIARLVPIMHFYSSEPRPKVGETIDPPFQIPDEAFAPLKPDELKDWGVES